MTFTVGQQCKTRDSENAEIIHENPLVAIITHNDGSRSALLYNDTGRFLPNGMHSLDLLPPKRSGTFWFNIYVDGTVSVPHSTEGKAAGEPADGIIARGCPLEWTEGDGLP